MKAWIQFAVLMTLAGVGLIIGMEQAPGENHAWLSLALVSMLAAAEARFWRPE